MISHRNILLQAPQIITTIILITNITAADDGDDSRTWYINK